MASILTKLKKGSERGEGPARVLVIDDEANIRMMVRLALEHAGHTVETAADGPEGLEKFGTGHPWDLVLLDQRMPGMEGLDVLREIRRRQSKARVIMITAFGTVELAVDAMKAGATDFLRKPFTTEILRGAVRAALTGAVTTAPANMPDAAGPTFGLTTLNGYRIESYSGSAMRSAGDISFPFTVRNPDGEARICTVVLPSYVVELVKCHADRDQMPGGDRFWQALCEEVLANYLWQHADFPPEGAVRQEELTGGLRTWIDAVLSANAG